MNYNYIKVLHIIAIIVWMGGMIFSTVIMRAISCSAEEERRSLTPIIRRWYVITTSTAMIATWIFGVTLMSMGNWFASTWMMAKVGLVICLSAIHGTISGSLRRLASDVSFQPFKRSTILVWLQIAALFGIVVLVVLKPL